ncbi:hypothetical protein [Lysobacter silvisoli]|uniref:Uncharacterized protein n=1 Tax=Lysobacter silvisoli TaxID=2293254 RepID=A0A371JXA7_9GAMM|nr:hypothetical protein [Lysobacter silvisoli]RDZ26299.1 hypothetical protein DX914_18720 [Lysobacter silvisoli]
MKILDYLLREEIDAGGSAATAAPPTPAAQAAAPPATAPADPKDAELARLFDRLMQPEVLRAIAQLLR